MTLLNFDPNSTIIILDVELENNKQITTKRFALDTGATYILIPWDVADVLKIRPEFSEERIETVTASGVEKVPLINIESVRVLGKEVKNVKAIVHDLPTKSYVDGLLGLSFLKNFNVHINFKKGELIFE